MSQGGDSIAAMRALLDAVIDAIVWLAYAVGSPLLWLYDTAAMAPRARRDD